jgi:hypothetical protein
MTRKQAEGFYAVHRGKPFFDSLRPEHGGQLRPRSGRPETADYEIKYFFIALEITAAGGRAMSPGPAPDAPIRYSRGCPIEACSPRPLHRP